MAAVEKKAEDNPWKKAVRNIFFTQRQVAAPTPAPATTPATSAVKPEPPPVAPSSAMGIVDEEMVKKLWELIEKHDQDGFDFLEYNRVLNSKKTIRDVDRHTNAYETAKALSKESDVKSKLLSSGAHYLQVLMTEKQEFETGFEDIVEEEIGAKKKDQAALHNDVQALLAQKEELDRKIAEKNEVLAQLDDSIATKEVELNRKKKNFIATLDAVVSDITSKLEGIKMHIPDENTTEKQA
jgi:CII-binding regulator of phage lambda lysogenization HflD